MRYSYIAYPNDRKHLYVHNEVCKVKGDNMNLYYYSKKRTTSSYIPEVIRLPINFVSKEGIVLSFAAAPECHMFLPETHALFNSYVILHADGNDTIDEKILIDILHKLYLGVMKEWRKERRAEWRAKRRNK